MLTGSTLSGSSSKDSVIFDNGVFLWWYTPLTGGLYPDEMGNAVCDYKMWKGKEGKGKERKGNG